MLRVNQNRPRTFNFVDAKEHLPNGSCREDAKTAQERAISQRRVGEGRHVNITLPYGACLKAGRRLSERRCTRVDASEQSDEHKSHSDQDRRSRSGAYECLYMYTRHMNMRSFLLPSLHVPSP